MKKIIVIISAFCCMALTYITGCYKESTINQVVKQKPQPLRKLDYEPKLQIDKNLEKQAEKDFPLKEIKEAEKEKLKTALEKANKEAEKE